MSSLALLIFIFPAHLAAACGNIIGPTDYVSPDLPILSTAITDCENPFGTTSEPSPMTFRIAGAMVSANDEIAIAESGTTNYQVEADNTVFAATHALYRHDGGDLIYIESLPKLATEADYETLAETFFLTTEEATLYLSYLVDGEDAFVDPAWQWEVYEAFVAYVAESLMATQQPLTPGTYTLVSAEVVPGQFFYHPASWLEQLRSFFIPTAYAQFPVIPPIIHSLTFSLVAEEPAPSGASSVLFLPGIQASRLYKDGLLGEDQLWEPNVNQDVRQLAMTEAGESIEEIYTKDVIDEVALPLFGDNIYKGFLGQLADLEAEQVINDYEAFAYDWRYDVFTIAEQGTTYEAEIKSLVDTVETLADNSYTGKVTVIGHSNGGLLGKALITELTAVGKEELIDKIVLVGVPQLGTPKALGVLLHGLEQQKFAGLIIGDETARAVTSNMPGVYTLLPSPRYFEETEDTLVTTDGSPNASSVAAYGDIVSYESMTDFVLDSADRRPADVPINEPGTLNQTLFDEMTAKRTLLDSWQAPAGIEVYEIVGTGHATIKGFEYKPFPCGTGTCLLERGDEMKPYPLFTNEGDETVLALSASAYQGEKVVGVVDLVDEVGLFGFPNKHADMTESPTVQDFIDSIIRFPYLADTLETPDDFIEVETSYTIIGVHSPVQISLETDTGERVGAFGGELVEEVVGSQYFEIGGSSYLVIPEETNYTVTVEGQADGRYSLTVDTLRANNIQSNEYTYLGATTSPTMIATFSRTDEGFSNLQTDRDGDGVVDFIETLSGELITQPEVVFTYADLRANIEALDLKKNQAKLLLLEVRKAEQFKKRNLKNLEILALRLLDLTLKRYERKSFITEGDYEELEIIINFLREKNV